MKRQTSYEKDKVFYHIITLIICLAIILLTSAIMLISFFHKSNSQTTLGQDYYGLKEYNDEYFSSKILRGVTVSGVDVGSMTVDEARQYLSGAVDYNIRTNKLVLKLGEKSWEFDRNTLKLTVDVNKATQMAYRVGRYGTTDERNEKLAILNNGGKVDFRNNNR